MEYPPPAVVHAGPSLQTTRSSCSMHIRTCAGCGDRSFEEAPDPVPNSRSFVCVHHLIRMCGFAKFYLYRTPPLPISTSPIRVYILAAMYYSTYYLSLYRIWCGIYHLSPDTRISDWENVSPTSRRRCWTKTVHRMTRVWTLLVMVSSLVIT